MLAPICRALAQRKAGNGIVGVRHPGPTEIPYRNIDHEKTKRFTQWAVPLSQKHKYDEDYRRCQTNRS